VPLPEGSLEITVQSGSSPGSRVSYLDETARTIRDAVPFDRLPADDDLEQLFLLYAVLARAKGMTTTASDVHDAWSAWMLARGAEHEAIRPYEELDAETRRGDVPFLEAIRQVAADSE
jgi:hypothetical protein